MEEFERILAEINAALRKGKNNLLIPAMNDGLANYKKRIFEDARATKAKYSTKPYYQSLSQETKNSVFRTPKQGSQISNAKFKPRGKFSRKSKFKNGKLRKTMYLKQGYKEFRKRAGRRTDKVNFELTGELRLGIQLGTIGDSIAWGTTSKEASDKLQGLSKKPKFGKDTFLATEEDIKIIEKAFLRELNRLLSF